MSDPAGNPEDRFSHNEAQLSSDAFLIYLLTRVVDLVQTQLSFLT